MLQTLKCQCEWVCQMPVRPLYLVPKGNMELEKGGAREVHSELNLLFYKNPSYRSTQSDCPTTPFLKASPMFKIPTTPPLNPCISPTQSGQYKVNYSPSRVLPEP